RSDVVGPRSCAAAAELGHRGRQRARGGGTAVLLPDFSRVPFVAVPAARAVETIACDARHMGRTVYCTGIRGEVGNVLAGLDADHCIDANRRFEKRIDALRAAVAQVGQSEQRERAGVPEAAPRSAPATG